MFMVKFGKITTQKLYTKPNNLKDSLPVDLGGTFENCFKTKQGKYSRIKESQIDK